MVSPISPYRDMFDVSAATVQLNQLSITYRLRHRPATVVRCVWWACRLWPRLRWGTLPATLAYLDEQCGATTTGGGSASPAPESVARTAGAVVRRLPRLGVGECLLRSLVIYAMLRPQRQVEIEFVLGAGPADEAGRPALHCWIEAAGRPLLETADPYACFQVLWRHRMP